MKMKLEVDLYFNKEQHVSRLITGFYLLEKEKTITLNLHENRNLIPVPHSQVVVAKINDKLIAFDMCDAFSLNNENGRLFLRDVDAYFKRSYDKQLDSNLSPDELKKVRPFGFDYFATYRSNPIDKQSSLKGKTGKFVKDVTGYNKCSYVNSFEGKADFKEKDFKVIFMTRLWNPDEIKINPQCPEYSEYMIWEREKINKDRINIVRSLRKIYGSRFTGGIQENAFAVENCPDLIIPRALTRKRTYLNTMKNSDICIGSMGLHRSTGWKTGEYIAAARAIVAETLKYEVPGNFEEGKNYLAFEDVDGCLLNVEALIKEPEKIYQMKLANELYYREYLRPEKQILNAISQIII